MSITKLTEIQIKEVLKKYDNGQSITSLNKEYHTTKIREILIQNNRKVPERKPKGSGGGAKSKYHFNKDYFENIDSKDKAYFLGFIYADGFITKPDWGQAKLGITLAEEEPIIKFKKYINSDNPIGIYTKGKNSYSEGKTEYKFALTSDKLVVDLEKIGVIERKTLVLTFPELREDLIPHFIRGYFDGDGSVFLHKDSRKEYCNNMYLGINICGTKEFLDKLLEHLSFIENSNCIYKELRKTTNCWNLKFESNIRSLKLYHYMYKDCDDLYLSRKKEIFENFIKEKGSETIITNPTNKDYLKLCYLED